TYTPNPDYNGADSFTFKANDGSLDSNVATVSITVSAVNDAPVANDDVVETNQNTPVTISVLANDSDVDLDVLTVTSVTEPANGSAINNGDGTITYTPDTSFTGIDSFDYTISDGAETAVATVTVVVTPVNANPVANNDSVSTNEDTVLDNIAVLANDTDADGDTLNITSFTQPTNGTVEAGTLANTLRYIPNANFNGVDTFTYTVSDGNGGTDTATVSVTVSAVNDAPVLNAIGDKTVDELSLLTFTASATDADIPANTLTFSLVGAPAGASINPSTGVFTWTPTEEQGPDAYTFDVVVTDNGDPNLSDSETITVTVDEVNEAPVLSPDPIPDDSADEGLFYSFTVTASDADVPAQILTFNVTGTPAWIAVDTSVPGQVTLSGTPTENDGGTTSTITIEVSDGIATTSDTYDLTVNEVNEAPVLNAIGDKTVDELSLLTFTASATDADIPANTLTF
ncbi:MAG: tandem-95 repeat protein, partial [Nitrososphaerales archaeon]